MTETTLSKCAVSNFSPVVNSTCMDTKELLLQGDFKGCTVQSDAATGTVIALSTQSQSDVDRWDVMPSLQGFPDLQRLSLDQNRYLLKLDESVTQLDKLTHLVVTRCTRLQEIPSAIGWLQNLQVVRCPCGLFFLRLKLLVSVVAASSSSSVIVS